MDKLLFLWALLTLVVVLEAQQDNEDEEMSSGSHKSCGENEMYTKCGNHPCLDSCLQPDLSRFCNYDKNRCYAGCICKRRYLRNEDDKCVLKKNCTYNDKREKIECTDPNSMLVKNPNICPGGTCSQPGYSQCNLTPPPYGCQCKTGFLKNASGKCIPSQECPVTNNCKANEVFKKRNKCEPTCENQEPTDCDLSAQFCTCKLGFVRNGGQCIRAYECPTVCNDPNEFFARCVPNCPQRCPGVDGEIPECNEDEDSPCQKGCVCKSGYYKTESGQCVLPSRCPPFTCSDPDKRYSKCNGSCQRSCVNVRGEPLKCGFECVSGCICRGDLVLGDDGKCIDSASCIRCAANEVYKSCAPKCPATCNRRSNRAWGAKWAERCKGCQPGCTCADGYVRQYRNGPCIKTNRCPQRRYGGYQRQDYEGDDDPIPWRWPTQNPSNWPPRWPPNTGRGNSEKARPNRF